MNANTYNKDKLGVNISCVEDAHHVDADSDAEFYLMRIRIQVTKMTKMMRIRTTPT